MGKLSTCVEACCCCCTLGAAAIKYTIIIIFYIIPVVICLAVGVTMIAIAVIYLDDCPYENMVPIWMIVGAIAPFFLLFFMIMAARDKSHSLASAWRILAYIILLTFLGWLIAGSVWVLKTWTNATSSCTSGANCCREILMKASLGMLLIHWGFFSLALIILLYIIIKVACCGPSSTSVKPSH